MAKGFIIISSRQTVPLLQAAVDVSDIRSRHKAAPKAGRALKSSQRQPSATADGDRPISFWTEENDEVGGENPEPFEAYELAALTVGDLSAGCAG